LDSITSLLIRNKIVESLDCKPNVLVRLNHDVIQLMKKLFKCQIRPDTARLFQSSPMANAQQHRNTSVEMADIPGGRQHMPARS